jgi:penicillin-binding protein 1A
MNRAPSRVRRWTRRLAAALLAALALVAVVVAALWPLTPGVESADARIRTRLAGHDARPLTALPSPDRIGESVIATENSRFYRDPAIDPPGVFRAGRALFAGSGDSGGATLEQQLAKVLYTAGHDGPTAQIEQIELAIKLDTRYSKPQILQMYLSAVYFGHGYYGVAAAAHGYFGVAPGRLSWGHAALLAGVVQAPSAYDPITHLALAKSRQLHVLGRLVDTGILTRSGAAAAGAAPLNLR